MISPIGWTRLSQENRERFKALYESGARITDIALQLQITKTDVGTFRDFLGLPKRLKYTHLPVEKILYSYVTLGMGATEIAEKVGVSRKSITRLLTRRGITVRKNKPTKKCAARRAEIFRRREKGEQMKDIAASLGLSTRTVRRRILEVLHSRA